MSARPIVSVFNSSNPTEKVGEGVRMPSVFTAPLRPDLVRFVHSNMAKNKRQAYGLSINSGYQTAAESWGTGRAVARIPRVPGGGTHRAGQAAFGNMCRGGGMFAPTKTWRRWHRKINGTQKRHAMASALAASSNTSLVLARGHRVEKVAEMPVVVSNESQAVEKTRDAVALLTKLGCGEDLTKVLESKKMRCGKGKLRNRRFVMRRGPLVVYGQDEGIAKACRNIPGVETCNVEALNLLQVAPGGTFGRLIVWTQSAFDRLNEMFGSYTSASTIKSNYTLPRCQMTNSDLAKLINSDEVQAVVRPAKEAIKHVRQRKNPLKNMSVRARMDPGAAARRKQRVAQQTPGTKAHAIIQKRAKATAAARKANRPNGKTFFKNLQAAYVKPVESCR